MIPHWERKRERESSQSDEQNFHCYLELKAKNRLYHNTTSWVSSTNVCAFECVWTKSFLSHRSADSSWGSTFREREKARRREKKRLGCGCSGNDRFAFKLVFTDSAWSIHTQTQAYGVWKHTVMQMQGLWATQNASTSVNLVTHGRKYSVSVVGKRWTAAMMRLRLKQCTKI